MNVLEGQKEKRNNTPLSLNEAHIVWLMHSKSRDFIIQALCAMRNDDFKNLSPKFIAMIIKFMANRSDMDSNEWLELVHAAGLAK